MKKKIEEQCCNISYSLQMLRLCVCMFCFHDSVHSLPYFFFLVLRHHLCNNKSSPPSISFCFSCCRFESIVNNVASTVASRGSGGSLPAASRFQIQTTSSELYQDQKNIFPLLTPLPTKKCRLGRKPTGKRPKLCTLLRTHTSRVSR